MWRAQAKQDEIIGLILRLSRQQREEANRMIFSATKKRRNRRRSHRAGRRYQAKKARALLASQQVTKPVIVVPVEACAYPAGEAHFAYEDHDCLICVRESTGRHSADVKQDRPRVNIPNGKPAEICPE
jgi:hypothetical protein